MYWARKHVLICTAQHCMQKGAQRVAAQLRIGLKRTGLDAEIMANTCDSIEICDIGPNIVVYPEGLIYHGVQVKDVPEIIDSLREGGQPVERLVLHPHDGDEQKRRELYESAVAAEPMLPEEFQALAEQYGWDEAWVNEQARRGFIARKPVDGETRVMITSKTRVRYGIATAPEESTASP